MSCDIGLVGLAVMGENLVLNMERNGFSVAVYNRTASRVEEFVNGRGAGKKITGTTKLEDFVGALKAPRRIMIMVRAGAAVDAVIDGLVPLLSPGDLLIDGGNSHYPDTNRRVAALHAKGLRFIGAGVSGGEEGALNGPSIMPGGEPDAWPLVKDIFQSISAKVDGEPCCEWVGEGGSGHFVKMVHNGIEYGDMQLISEAYDIMRRVLGMTNEEMHQVLAQWNQGDLESYLIEITRDILARKDDAEPEKYVVDLVLDAAGQKGTGKWTAQEALDQGIPLTLIGEAVFARCLSSMKEERVHASKKLRGPDASEAMQGKSREAVLEDLRDAVYASKIVSYAQGFAMMREAARQYGWNLNYGGIALMWRGGCIIRSRFLGRIKAAFEANANLTNLFLDPFFTEKLHNAQAGWRRTVSLAALAGIPIPAFGSALSYFDGYRTESLPANLLQSQRDYFGAHTYERIDKPRGEFFHTNWTGHGGTTSSTAYNS